MSTWYELTVRATMAPGAQIPETEDIAKALTPLGFQLFDGKMSLKEMKPT